MHDHISLQPDYCFWTGFYQDRDCFTWASTKAYLDMNRTMTFRDTPKDNSKEEINRVEQNRKKWLDKGTDVIRRGFSSPVEDFNCWHQGICDALIAIYSDDTLVLRHKNKRTEHSSELTYGQAQKWLNMTLKYLWLLDRLHLIQEESTHQFICANEKSFHVPLDSYILRYVARQDKNKKDRFLPQNQNGLNPDIDFSRFWSLFGSAWSQITDKQEYYNYQLALSQALDGLTPLEWELIHWHRALKYYR